MAIWSFPLRLHVTILASLSARLVASACILAFAAQTLPAQAWTVRETLRIGGSDDPTGTILGRVAAAVVDQTGRIHVADALSHDVRIFSPTGRLERTIGRRGRGPGEFENPSVMGFLGRELWVSDRTLRRVVFFDASGRPDSTTRVTYSPPTGFLASAPIAVAADGSTIIVPVVAGDRMVTGQAVSLPIVRVSPSGEVDTLHSLTLSDAAVAIDMGGQRAFLRQPLPALPISAVAADGSLIAVAEPTGGAGAPVSSFRLIVKDGNGRTVGQLAVPYTAARVPTRWRDSVVQVYAAAGGGNPSAQRQLTRRIEDALEFPATFPPVARVLVGADRTVWVQLAGSGATSQWRVFDERATPIGTVRLPAAMKLLHATRRGILATGLSADGEPVVVRYDVESSRPAAR